MYVPCKHTNCHTVSSCTAMASTPGELFDHIVCHQSFPGGKLCTRMPKPSTKTVKDAHTDTPSRTANTEPQQRSPTCSTRRLMSALTS
ncbi:hypothetical protein BX666DRAFT_1999269 [Dichotomocladium elegans]|nr:hypothetical protein BX666DRAFT_1999269 [Dichotomocladium elegans]